MNLYLGESGQEINHYDYAEAITPQKILPQLSIDKTLANTFCVEKVNWSSCFCLYKLKEAESLFFVKSKFSRNCAGYINIRAPPFKAFLS